jgi:hypothetical protein
MDFFLWGYTKDQVYRTRVICFQDLKKKNRIVLSVEGITPRMCVNAFWASEYRMGIVRTPTGAEVEVQCIG